MTNPTAEQDNRRDIAYQVGDLYPELAEPGVPMFSFSRPSRILWQAVYDGLIARGWSDADAITWLQSRGPRHLLDGRAAGWLKDAGSKIAEAADYAYVTD